MHRLFVPPAVAEKFDEECRNALIGCVDRKNALADALIEYLAPVTERFSYYSDHQDEVRDVIIEGSRRAREEAGRVMADVRRAMKIDW
jgi:tryptophanyl-tRNA synthetase